MGVAVLLREFIPSSFLEEQLIQYSFNSYSHAREVIINFEKRNWPLGKATGWKQVKWEL